MWTIRGTIGELGAGYTVVATYGLMDLGCLFYWVPKVE